MKAIQGDLTDLKVLYDRHKGRLPVTFDQMAECLKDWAIWRIEEDSTPVAVVLEKDGHGHIAAYGGAHVGIPRMRWALKTLGITKTTVGDGFPLGHALAKRLGFVIYRKANGVSYYVRS